MIKYIMRKTVLKNFDVETQDILLQLVYHKHLIEFFCNILRLIIYFYIFMPLIVAILYKDIPLTLASKILMVVLLLIYFIGIILLFKILTPDVYTFLQSLSEKIHFSLYTKKGEALSEKDFLILKNNNDTLYEYISSQKSRGCCYGICFEILRILKKGYIEFVAVKNISYIDDEEDDKSLTMHLIYVNNGWVFDTYCQRQIPMDKFYEIYKAKFYKNFSYDEIKDKSFDDFRKETCYELAQWCNENDCSEFWSI